MTAHDLRVTETARFIAMSPRPVEYPIDDLQTLRLARRLVVYTPSGPEIDELVAHAAADIPGLTGADVVKRMVAYNPDCLWAIARRDRFDPAAPKAEGVIAFLMLNQEGVRQLIAGSFNAADPDTALLTAQHEQPSGIYLWACHAKGPLAAAAPLAFQKMWTPLYRDADIFTRTTNLAAIRFVESMGFRRGPTVAGVTASHLHVYRRAPAKESELPSYDNVRPSPRPSALSVTVARSMEDMMRVISIRSAVYMAEQNCPYLEEFDGNDFAATHLIGYVGGEPAGCLRIRNFAEFAKIERLAVRHEFRSTRLAFKLVRGGIDLCRMKGYRRLYGHAQKRLANFWGRFGFQPLPGGHDLVFSDFDYVEMVMDTDPHPDAIRIGGDPYRILRAEGKWHEPGLLERSSHRGVTRPSVDAAHS
ncbi:MAG: GNAT family N-acetyltransferase [Xanthobacteraceae bacterium]